MNKVGGRFVSVFIDRLRPPIFLSVNTQTENHMLVYEVTAIKPLTPQQSQLVALKNNVDNAKNRLDAERKRQQVKKAQQRLQIAVASSSKLNC